MAKKLSLKDVGILYQLVGAGWTYAEIAKFLNVHESTVSYHMKKAKERRERRKKKKPSN